jgi:CBS domain-containing protein
MKVSDLLRVKGFAVKTVSADKTVRQVLKNIVENKVGCLVVTDNENRPIGIVTERDIIRLINSHEYIQWQDKRVHELMTKDILIGFPDDDVEYIMALMTENRFRHVPIISEGKLAGLVSIGDIVKSLLKDIKAENRHLADYISGKYPA